MRVREYRLSLSVWLDEDGRYQEIIPARQEAKFRFPAGLTFSEREKELIEKTNLLKLVLELSEGMEEEE